MSHSERHAAQGQGSRLEAAGGAGTCSQAPAFSSALSQQGNEETGNEAPVPALLGTAPAPVKSRQGLDAEDRLCQCTLLPSTG